MKRIILLFLSIFIIGCSVQEEVPSQEEEIPLKQEEEVVEKEYVFTKAELPYNNYDGKASQTYLYENRPKVEDDEQEVLYYQKDEWDIGKVSLEDENYEVKSLLNVLFTELQFEGKIKNGVIRKNQSYYDNQYYKFENIFKNYPEVKINDAYLESGYMPSNQLTLNGEVVFLKDEVAGYSEIFDGDKVRTLYQRLYNEECPISESTYIEILSTGITMSYDKDLDIFTYFEYYDGAVGLIESSKLFLINQKILDNIANFDVLQLDYVGDSRIDNIMYFKNSGLPILERHFSNESKKDGKLTISEMLKDQKDNIDVYQLTARINEDGTYTLLEYENQTPIHEAEDFIFYMNYEREDGKVQLLPLFDVSYAKQANQSLLTLLEEREDLPRQVGWYEDENIAVIWVEESDMNKYDIYAIDKLNHRMLENIDEEHEIYQQFIKQYSSEEEIEKCKLFEMDKKCYLFVDGLIYQVEEK